MFEWDLENEREIFLPISVRQSGTQLIAALFALVTVE